MKLVSEIRKNATVIFPVVGKVSFDEDGCIEVSDEDGQAILDKKVNDVREFGTKTASQEDVDAKKSARNQLVDDAVANIKSMKSYADLHKLCNDAKLPKDIWGDMKVPELKAYLISKVDPNAKPEEVVDEGEPESDENEAQDEGEQSSNDDEGEPESEDNEPEITDENEVPEEDKRDFEEAPKAWEEVLKEATNLGIDHSGKTPEEVMEMIDLAKNPNLEDEREAINEVK